MTEAKLNNVPPAVPDLLRAAGDILPAMARAGQEAAAKLNLPFDASVNAQIVSQPGHFAMSLSVSMNAAPPASLPPPSVSQDSSKTYGKGYKEGFDRGYARGHEDGLAEAGSDFLFEDHDGDNDDDDDDDDNNEWIEPYDPDGDYRDEEERAEAEFNHYLKMSERLSQ